MKLPGEVRSRLLVIVALGITQTIGYGSLYYAFTVLAAPMAADTGLSLTAVYGLFSVGLFTGGIAAPFAGRMLDRFNAPRVMALGSALAAGSLALWALLPGIAAFAIFAVLTQAISVLVQYEAAFVAAARLVPSEARKVITGITLIAGFASTIFWPLTTELVQTLSWREIHLVYAGLNLLICCPLHLFLSGSRLKSRLDRQNGAQTGSQAPNGEIGNGLARRIVYVLLLIAFSANAYVIAAVHLHLIGLLGAMGLGLSAALIGSIIGPAQVAGRMAEMASGGRANILAVSLFAAGALPLALLLLVGGAPSLIAGVAFAVLFGVGQGLSYIVRGVLPLQIFGPTGYGALMGKFNLARLFVAAGAPFLTAAIFEYGGAEIALTSIIIAALIGVSGLAGVVPILRRNVVQSKP